VPVEILVVRGTKRPTAGYLKVKRWTGGQMGISVP